MSIFYFCNSSIVPIRNRTFWFFITVIRYNGNTIKFGFAFSKVIGILSSLFGIISNSSISHEYIPHLEVHVILEKAAKKNQYEILKYICDRFKETKGKEPKFNTYIFNEAMHGGSVKILEYLMENNCLLPEDKLKGYRGCWIKWETNSDFEKILWLMKNNLLDLKDTYVCGCYIKESIEIDEPCYIFDNNQPNKYPIRLETKLNLEIIQFLVNNGAKLLTCLEIAIQYSKDKTLMKWILKNTECQDYHFILSKIPSFEDLNELKKLKEEGFIFGDEPFIEALDKGNIEIIKWLHENFQKHFYIDKTFCFYSAQIGNLKVLKCLRENNYPWDKSICRIAARMGRLEILKWCRENGCEWDEDTTTSAFEKQNWQCFMYALKNNCPTKSEILKEAIKFGFNIEILIPNYHKVLLY